nr:immunoglobulin light chain junction region [Macaca mulatta]MOV99129.1 immunoglobulin light chain junction region [Macaca mulatta]MOV99142.1 immunoglobulin light chain junction region [Macaca mulatta]
DYYCGSHGTGVTWVF